MRARLELHRDYGVIYKESGESLVLFWEGMSCMHYEGPFGIKGGRSNVGVMPCCWGLHAFPPLYSSVDGVLQCRRTLSVAENERKRFSEFGETVCFEAENVGNVAEEISFWMRVALFEDLL
ncbi:hypothetical protein HNY73_010194 [Argiope bruennichi]|uniref:Uncharacterized protein n=1 Tax=Argiope bruennichi TaxID=94029 RepID=A0A8T0F543_ARGBR|nr:hypothetical protein HNY73_010194 [Argiope bruennichi]